MSQVGVDARSTGCGGRPLLELPACHGRYVHVYAPAFRHWRHDSLSSPGGLRGEPHLAARFRVPGP